jgi:hypothetical protein
MRLQYASLCRKVELLQNLSATLEGDVGGGIQHNVVKSISCCDHQTEVCVVHLIQM